MKPTKGRVVLVHGRNHNGQLEHVAIVTSVNDADKTVNVCLMPDGCAPYAISNVRFSQTPQEGSSSDMVAYWPPRQSEPVKEETTTVTPSSVPSPQKPNGGVQASPGTTPQKKK